MSHQTQQTYCPVCYPEDQQVVGILYRLVKQILKEEKTLTPSKLSKLCNSAEQKSINTENGVKKLIKFIFNSKFQLAQQTCKHEIVRSFLILKTQLSENKIDAICQLIYQFQAKRNYEIEVLGNQVKCFSKTIGEELNRKSKKSQLSEQKSEVFVKEESDKVSEMERIDIGRKAETIPTATTIPTAPAVQPVSGPIFIPYYFQAYHPMSYTSFFNNTN